MKLRISATLGLVALVISGTAAASTPVSTPCDGLDEIEERVGQLLELGRLDLAADYLAAQDTEETSADCVDVLTDEVDAQRRRAARLATDAKQAAQAGEKAEAVELYLAALDLDADNSRTQEELSLLLHPSERGSFNAAVALHDAGYDEAAETEVVEQVTEKGVIEAIPAELHKEGPDWYEEIVDELDDHVLAPLKPDNLPWTIATVAVVLATVILALRLITRPLTPKRPGEPWAGRRHRFARFLARTSPTRRAVRPVVKFEFDQEGAEVKALAGLRDAVTTALVRDSSAENLQRAGSGDLGSALTEIDVGIPSVNTASKVLARLFVQRVITVSMTLEPVHDNRVGATVVVTDWRGRTFDARRFHGEERKLGKDDKPDYMALSPRITAWLGFVLADVWRAGDRPIRVAGTAVPGSYESYLAGYQARDRGDDELAKKHYHRALERDSDNKYTMLGIGVIDAHDTERLDNAIDMLCESRKFDDAATMTYEHAEFVRWSQASYSAAVAYLHRSATVSDPRDDLRHAENIDLELFNLLCAGQREAPRSDLMVFCAQSLPLARTLLNSIRLERNGRLPTLPTPPATTDEDWMDFMSARTGGPTSDPTNWTQSLEDARKSPSTRYNLACTYARAARRNLERGLQVPGAVTGLEDMALMHLRRVMADQPSSSEAAHKDEVFKTLKDRRPTDFDAAIGKKQAVEPDGWKVLRLERQEA